MRTPTNCRTRSISVSARSRRRWRPSKPIARLRSGRDRPRRRLRQHRCRGLARRSIAAMSGRRTRRPCVEPESDARRRRATIDGAESHGLGPARGHHGRRRADRAVEEDDDDAIKPLPDRLITELTAHRTLALRDALANEPARRLPGGAAQVRAGDLLPLRIVERLPGDLDPDADVPRSGRRPEGERVGQGDRRAPRGMEGAAAQGRGRPVGLRSPRSTGQRRPALFAHCASSAVNALYEPANRYNEGRVSAARRPTPARSGRSSWLAPSGSTWSSAGWRPTVDNYLGRVTKPRILEAVREAKGEQSAQLIDHLKKGDMAREAERLLDGTGWLPEPLRLVGHRRRAARSGRRTSRRCRNSSREDDEDAADADERPAPHHRS